jgi:Undecaprenyl-phosphate galactose phosphotransferase WbaP
MFLSDLTALLAAALVAYVVWPRLVLGQPIEIYTRLIPLMALFPLILGIEGLYPGFGLGAAETIRRLVSGTSLSFIMVAGASFVLKASPEHSRVAFALAWLLSVAMLPLMRFFTLTIVRRLQWWGEPTIVIGSRAQIELTLDLVRDAKSLGYRVVGALCSDRAMESATIAGVTVLGGPELAPAIGASGIRTALAWGGWTGGLASRKGALERKLRVGWLQHQFRHVVLLRGDEGLPVEHVQVRNLGTVFGIEITNELLRRENRIVKRALDLTLGTLFLALAAPVTLLAGLAVKMLSRGPMFFCQEREGLGGRKVRIWKLRTMYADAEKRLEDCLAANPALRREWEAKYKLARDPRVVRLVGRWLRRFSIDELPQLWCVVAGTMSLVGPRPLPDYHLRIFAREFMDLRRSVRPGLTGLWQVTVRSDGALDEHRRYDSYYIRNWSVWLDLYIMAKTIFAVLAARGAC